MTTKSRYLFALFFVSILAGAARVDAQNYTPYNITTFAGSFLNPGLVNATGTNAEFNKPNAVAVDSSGNIYVADTGNDAIRMITSAGVVTTVATGFGPLYGIVADNAGNLYVSDQINSAGTTGAIKKVSIASGSVSVVVSSGLAGPMGLTLDSSGNLYVADSGNSVVRKIVLSSGAMSVYAGTAGSSGSVNGGVGTGKLGFPTGVAFDNSGNLYVTDAVFDQVREVGAGGTLSTYAGSAGVPSSTDGTINGNPTNVGFQGPVAIASDSSGNLFIVDAGVIREITTGGVVSTLAGSFGATGSNNGAGQNALFSSPAGIAVTASDTIYVADTGNNEIRRGTSVANQPPTIQYPPTAVTSTVGGSANFMVTASGSNLSYQWYLNGTAISGATTTPLQLTNLTASQAGTYTVVVSNSYGSVTSAGALLTISGGGTAPVITSEPTATTSGTTTTLTVTASGSNLLYQWYLNGAAVSGATSSTLVLNGVTAAQAGSYTVTVTNGYGSTPSNPVTVAATAPTVSTQGRLINLSVLTSLAANGSFTVGFVSGGSGTSGSEPVLVRASGPSLAQFVAPPYLDNPSITFYNSANSVNTAIAANSAWGGNSTISTISTQVGAFSLISATSKDAALYLPTAPTGADSIAVTGIGTVAGQVLAEIYDATPASSYYATSPRLINESVVQNMGSLLTVGFTIGGTTNLNVLIRAVGPTLANFEPVGTVVATNPQLKLFAQSNNSSPIQTNNVWGGTQALINAMNSTGAFSLPTNSLDSAMIANLAPGTYSVQASVGSGSTGLVLVDLYEIP